VSRRRIGGALVVLAGTWIASTGCGRDGDSTTGGSTGSTGGSSSGGSTGAPCVPGETRACAPYSPYGETGCDLGGEQTCLAGGTWGTCINLCNTDPYAVHQTCVCSDGCPGMTICVAGHCDVCQCDCDTCAGARCALEYSTCSGDCLEEHVCTQNCASAVGAGGETGLVEPSDVDRCVAECALGSAGLPTPEFEAFHACIMQNCQCASLCYGLPGPSGSAGAAGAGGATAVAGASGTAGQSP